MVCIERTFEELPDNVLRCRGLKVDGAPPGAPQALGGLIDGPPAC